MSEPITALLIPNILYLSKSTCDIISDEIYTMEHIKKSHLYSKGKKSSFVDDVNVDQLINEVLADPSIVRQHITKPKRWWYLKRFSTVIGHRGIDGARCRWLAVLVDSHHLITSFPIPHPSSMKSICQL